MSKVGLLWGEVFDYGKRGRRSVWLWEKGGVFEILDQISLENLSLCLYKWI
jgi:hypothetical protein